MGDLYQAGLPLLLSAGGGRSFDLLSPDPGLIFWTVLTFIGLLFLLRKTAWGPIIDGLDRREESIRGSLADAAKARDEAQSVLEQQRTELAKARGDAQKIIDLGNASAKTMQEEILAKAQAEAGEVIESAKREIALETDRARQALREEVVDLSLRVAGKLLERSLTGDDHERMAREFMSKVDEA
jgi:F-type H+-transporting ATPase subunit b